MPGIHGGGCDCRDETAALSGAKWLNPVIALDQARCLNVEDGDIKDVLKKTYDQRIEDDLGWVRSPEDDTEMLVHIPFSSPVMLQSIYVIGGPGCRHPRKVRLFCDPAAGETMDFSDVNDRNPTETIELVEDLCGALEYPVKANRFTNMIHLVMHFESAEGEENINGEGEEQPRELFWIGLKGVPTEWKCKAVETVYESQANLADHDSVHEEQSRKNNVGM